MAITKILVPVDLSSASVPTLDYAIEFARSFEAELVLLFVVEPLYHAGDLGLLLEEQQRRGRSELAELEGRARRHHVACRTLVQRGVPYVEIVATAKRLKASLILMGTHGRTGLSHLILGSVTDRVVRSAECPVLTVRTPLRRKR